MTRVSNQTTIFEDDFDGDVIGESKWFPHYLPH